VDIFYHWRDFALDMKEGRIYTLGSNGVVLEQLKERLPRKAWTIATPKGRKDRLRLVGSSLITEPKPVSFLPKWKYNLSYDAASPKSVLYTGSDSPEKIDAVRAYFNLFGSDSPPLAA
jgi:hypothetical protein